jgi:glycerol-3-phosphate dehydrogenase (NAD+)
MTGSSALFQLGKGPLKVTIVGCGNWGTRVASLAASNTLSSYIFETETLIYVRPEEGDLVHQINEQHVNTRYLPNVKLPTNLVATNDLLSAVAVTDLLVIVLPHRFVISLLKEIRGFIKPNSRACSLVKGLICQKDGSLRLLSDIVEEELQIDCCVMAGANIAEQVEAEEFAEGTIGYNHIESALLFQLLFHTPFYRVSGVTDIAGVQICSALKNVVALAAGFVDGLGLRTNSKSAIIRIGFQEIRRFAKQFYNGVADSTFFESCGIADLIATCSSGRNRLGAEIFAQHDDISFGEVEQQYFNGQQLEGPITCKEVYHFLRLRSCENQYPLLCQIYRISFESNPTITIVGQFKVLEPIPFDM